MCSGNDCIVGAGILNSHSICVGCLLVLMSASITNISSAFVTGIIDSAAFVNISTAVADSKVGDP